MGKYDFIKIKKKLSKYLDEARFEHTMGVMYTCAALAMVYDYDLEDAQAAGLLHDSAKCIPNKKKLKLCSQHDIPVSDFEKDHPFLLHAKLGAYVASSKYDIKDEEILTQLAIPPLYWDVIAESWRARDPSLYGRMDFAWCGNAPVKLLEYNADTPTSLYESAYFQWLWLEDARRSGIIPRDADQYNAIQERLISRFSELYSREPFYFCCCQDTDEDRSTVLYLQDCAQQAGQESRFIYIEDLGLGVGGVLTDLDDNVIQRAFKLYPLEWMMRDDNGPLLRKRREQWVEPLWKSILSNKGLMPLLWRFFPGHPNLLASWFEGEKPQIAAGESYVRKPLYSREGGNVTIFDGQNNVVDHADGDYADEPMIYQAFQPLPRFGDSYTLIGSWIVDDEACGMGIREDNTLITKDTSRFVPHYIAG